jgi:predicted NAD/FAD-dependent oxidoreductase
MEYSGCDLVDDLPQHLSERTRAVGCAAERATGEFVVYWLHHAMRAYENPALDVAVTTSNQVHLPFLVYQAISESYPYASDNGSPDPRACTLELPNTSCNGINRPRVAIVGAGISGLMCARTLLDHGIDVTVFEKSRGVGGRMATRRTAEGPRFDHGAQYFTVRDMRFERYVQSWIEDGVVAPWHGRICTLTNGRIEWKNETTPRFVGVPGMNAICRHLAADLDITFGTQVGPPRFDEGIWHLSDKQEKYLGEFDCVISSAPAPQSAELLAAAADLQQQTQLVKMNGCWAAMLTFDQSLELPFDGAFVHQSLLSWIARNNSKPGRADQRESWVVHASPEWTGKCLEDEPNEVLPKLVEAFWQATGAKARKSDYAAIHRWRYAIPPEPLESRCLFDTQLRIGACGDWCSGPRVEGAFLSGMAIAGQVLAHAEALAQPSFRSPP